ncbi:hypothetical protein [Saccharomonospora saliphila]|uniref:hypothetical protein n=1 Tax=Saccharomonospora saliphila TaxID=369829 RepID=UPI000360D5E5|nr:hypothetical protein [Saccharomonospora saliphila]
MRLASSLAVAVLLIGSAAACADREPRSSAPTMWRAPASAPQTATTPMVTLTEPAGGPTRTGE